MMEDFALMALARAYRASETGYVRKDHIDKILKNNLKVIKAGGIQAVMKYYESEGLVDFFSGGDLFILNRKGKKVLASRKFQLGGRKKDRRVVKETKRVDGNTKYKFVIEVEN